MDATVTNHEPDASSRAFLGGMLSLWVPGLGQIFARQWSFGVTLVLCDIVAGTLGTVMLGRIAAPALMPAYIAFFLPFVIFHIWAAIDASRRIRRLVRWTRVRPVYSTWFCTAMVILAGQGIKAVIPPPVLLWSNIVDSFTMPALLTGDFIISRTPEPGTTPAYGDIVLFNNPKDPAHLYIRRVVALEGDHVALKHGQLYLNGNPVPESPVVSDRADDAAYTETLPSGRRFTIVRAASDSRFYDRPDIVVPAGHVFVMGDNRDNSVAGQAMEDIGLIPTSSIAARMEFVVFSSDPWDGLPVSTRIRWNRLMRRLQ